MPHDAEERVILLTTPMINARHGSEALGLAGRKNAEQSAFPPLSRGDKTLKPKPNNPTTSLSLSPSINMYIYIYIGFRLAKVQAAS